MGNILELNGVSKVYVLGQSRVLEALKSVSLHIQRGEVLGLLGVNGAGKTTLSSILATLHPPTAGSILYNGASIYENLMAYRRDIGFCPQRPNVSPYLTLRQSLYFAAEFYGLAENFYKKRADELMADFGLMSYADQSIRVLSGGYKQRFMIARAIMHAPKIIFFDEPTVALDAPVRRYLWGIIKELKQSGVTIVLTTHYLEEAEQLADRVCLLHKGKIQLVDSLDNLKNKFAVHNLESVFMALLEETSHD